jgi:hypothetical protein
MLQFSSDMFEITLSERSRCKIVYSFNGEGTEFDKGMKQKGERIKV